jgi:hypothetical protein
LYRAQEALGFIWQAILGTRSIDLRSRWFWKRAATAASQDSLLTITNNYYRKLLPVTTVFTDFLQILFFGSFKVRKRVKSIAGCYRGQTFTMKHLVPDKKINTFLISFVRIVQLQMNK